MSSARAIRRFRSYKRSTAIVSAATLGVFASSGAPANAVQPIVVGRQCAVPTAATQACLRGVLKGPKGRPIPNLGVSVLVTSADGASQRVLGSANTDAVGNFSIEPDMSAVVGDYHDGDLVQLITVPGSVPGFVGIPQYSTAVLLGNTLVDSAPAATGTVSAKASSTTSLASVSLLSSANYTTMWMETPYGMCQVGYTIQYMFSTTLPDSLAWIGTHQIEKGATGWTEDLTYKNTRSSSFQTGAAITVGVPGLSFTANGQVRNDSSFTSYATTRVAGSADTATNKKQLITIGNRLDHWGCRGPGLTDTFGEKIVVVVPGKWKRDFYPVDALGIGLIQCASGPIGIYGANTTMGRVNGQSRTDSSAFGVTASSNGKSGSFRGSITVGISSSSGKEVQQVFKNSSTGVKHLCGEKSNDLASATNVGIILAKL